MSGRAPTPRIGILNLTRFGDLIQTSPVITGLRKRHPDARIELIVKSRFRPVTELLPRVDAVHEIDGDALASVFADPDRDFLARYRATGEMVEPLEQIPFDLLLNFTHSPASAVLLSLMQGADVRGFTIDRQGQRLVEDPWLGFMATLVRNRRLSRFNLVDVYLGAAGVLGRGERLSIRMPDAARAVAETLLPGGRSWVALQLGASSRIRSWEVESFAAFARALVRRTERAEPAVGLAVVGVRGDAVRAEALRAACPEIAIENLCGRTSIPELAAVVERSRLLVTGDTGTMHLAGAAGTPTVALFFGPAYPHETGVYAEGHLAIHSRVECAPCHHMVECGRPVCHDDVPPEWLAELCARTLERRSLDDLEPLPRAEVLRTGFDPDGLWEAVPLWPRRARAEDLLALAYRAVFAETLGGLDGPGAAARVETVWRAAERRFGASPADWKDLAGTELSEPLARMCELAREGERETASLMRADASAALRGAGETLARVDREVYGLARAQPLLGPLGFGLQNSMLGLPEADIARLAVEAGGHYRTLGRRAAFLRDAIGAN